jgi:RNA polymerase sigma-70 factor (ECF subfamily)
MAKRVAVTQGHRWRSMRVFARGARAGNVVKIAYLKAVRTIHRTSRATARTGACAPPDPPCTPAHPAPDHALKRNHDAYVRRRPERGVKDDETPDASGARGARSGPPVDGPLALPLDFEAFYLTHQQTYHQYAEAQLGDPGLARDVVHSVFSQLRDGWPVLLGSRNLEQEAWALLRWVVAEALGEDAPPSFVLTGALLRTLRPTRERPASSPPPPGQGGAGGAAGGGGAGLYSAIAALPTRQFDVIVLRHILGRGTQSIAWLLGLDPRTVDYHGRHGKERLRVQLGIPAERAAGAPADPGEPPAANGSGEW